jgi:hypothetical protein
MPLDFRKLDQSVLGPVVSSPAENEDGRHFVHIYDEDASLVDAVATFLSLGLEAGEGALVIARPDHIAAFEEAVGSAGVDMGAAHNGGRWRAIRSQELLADFMVDGLPDPDRFLDSIAGLFLSIPAGKVRIFGEMVADLWAEGRIPAAMRLEELWNDLGPALDFQLFCGYPAAAFHDSDLISVAQVCRQHTQVIAP